MFTRIFTRFLRQFLPSFTIDQHEVPCMMTTYPYNSFDVLGLLRTSSKAEVMERYQSLLTALKRTDFAGKSREEEQYVKEKAKLYAWAQKHCLKTAEEGASTASTPSKEPRQLPFDYAYNPPGQVLFYRIVQIVGSFRRRIRRVSLGKWKFLGVTVAIIAAIIMMRSSTSQNSSKWERSGTHQQSSTYNDNNHRYQQRNTATPKNSKPAPPASKEKEKEKEKDEDYEYFKQIVQSYEKNARTGKERVTTVTSEIDVAARKWKRVDTNIELGGRVVYRSFNLSREKYVPSSLVFKGTKNVESVHLRRKDDYTRTKVVRSTKDLAGKVLNKDTKYYRRGVLIDH